MLWENDDIHGACLMSLTTDILVVVIQSRGEDNWIANSD